MTQDAIAAFKGGGPVTDGKLIPTSVAEAFSRRQEAQVPYIVGFNSVELPSTRENLDVNLAATSPLDDATRAKLTAAYGDEADFILNAVGDFNSARRRVSWPHSTRAMVNRPISIDSRSCPKSCARS